MALALALASSPVLGQVRFAELGRADHLPPERLLVNDVAVGDLDGDGQADIVVLDPVGVRILRGNGEGVFSELTRVAIEPGGSPGALCFLDIDADNDLDVLTAIHGAGSLLLENLGGGSFASRPTAVSGRVWALVAGDIDGDGDPDVCAAMGHRPSVGGPGIPDRLYRNDGGTLVDVSATHLPSISKNTRSAGFFDADGDGDLDVVLGHVPHYLGPPANNNLLLNNGQGVFTQAGTGVLPVDTMSEEALVFGDMDGDGDADFVAANSAPLGAPPWNQGGMLFRNDGGGNFSADPTAFAPPNASMALASGDIDGDGDIDLVRGAGGSVGGSVGVEVYYNDGSGAFSLLGNAHAVGSEVSRLVVFDADNRAGPDVFVGNRGGGPTGFGQRARLLLADGAGGLSDATASLTLGRPTATRFAINTIALGDVGGDGDLDLIEYGEGAEPLRLYHNTGDGPSVDVTSTHLPVLQGRNDEFGVVDADGDGDDDIWIELRQGASSNTLLLLGDNAGSFRSAPPVPLPVPTERFGMTSMKAADLDGDGDPDLVLHTTRGIELVENRGAAGFVLDTRSQFSQGVGMFALGDVDGDGDIDLLAKTAAHLATDTIEIYRNQGNGTFALSGTVRLPVPDGFESIELVGVDGDPDLDLMVFTETPYLFLNDGSGVFSQAPRAAFPLPRRRQRNSRVADIDLDGDTDVITAVTLYGLTTFELFANDGTGEFTNVTATELPPAPTEYLTSFEVGDLDGDADPDVVFYERWRGASFWWNLHRHANIPVLFRRGLQARLDYHGRFGHAGGDPEFVLPQIALGDGALPIPPLGVLRLELSSLLFLSPLVLPTTNPTASVAFRIPPDPGVIGVRLHTQAIHLGIVGTPFLAWRYGNHWQSEAVR